MIRITGQESGGGIDRDASAKHAGERQSIPSGRTHEKTYALLLANGGSIVLTAGGIDRYASAKHAGERQSIPSGRTHEGFRM